MTVMFKTKRASQQIFFNEINWNYFNEDGNPDVTISPSTGTNSSPTTESELDFKEYTFTVNGLKDFNSFAIKVIMKSRNPLCLRESETLEQSQLIDVTNHRRNVG